MRMPDLAIWKSDFANRFRSDWHPRAWITPEAKERLIERVNACATWDEVRAIAPYCYLPK